jgi:V8-like Glu-specific endopeptidase
MSRLSSFLFFVLLTSEAFAAPRDLDRVFNGNILNPMEHKHLVRLELNAPGSRLKCSGSIINANWIVTAAHCTYKRPSATAYQNTASSNTLVAHIDANRIHTNPNFAMPQENIIGGPYAQYDIALMNTNQPIAFTTFVQPIQLSFTVPSPNQPGVLAGYGCNDKNTQFPTEGRVSINEVCRQPHVYVNTLCSNGITHSGSGDSSGPLVTQSGLVGVISAIILENSGNNAGPGVTFYSSIAFNQQWIRSIVPM